MPLQGGGWRIEGEGVGPSGVHRTKDEAVKVARTLAKANKPSQFLVYKKDGTVQRSTPTGKNYRLSAIARPSRKEVYESMASKPAVHIEPGESGWAVVREGNERATSVHPTQAEAAKEGRELAHRDETEFFLHARDGRIREHHSYEKPSRSEKEEAAGHAVPGAQEEPSQEASGSEKATDVAQDDEPFAEATDDAEEVHAYAAEQRGDRSATLEEHYTGYEVHDVNGERIGKIDYLFVDENDELEYFGVKTGVLGAKAVLIPIAVVRVDDHRRIAEVNAVKAMIEEGPSFESDEEITLESERWVHNYYGIEGPEPSGERAAYGTYYASEALGGEEPDLRPSERLGFEEERHRDVVRDTLYREREELQELRLEKEGLADEPKGELIDEGELRVRRIEEELKVGTREREAGAVRVRKRVVTDHETIVVPKKRVEVTVEHVPVEEEAISAEEGSAKPEIGEEEEIVVPVVEEEVVVEKRPVVKEEIRIRKEVVEDSEVVEEDVRREEVEVDDETTERHDR